MRRKMVPPLAMPAHFCLASIHTSTPWRDVCQEGESMHRTLNGKNVRVMKIHFFFKVECAFLFLKPRPSPTAKGHPNDCQEMRDVTCRFKTLAEFGLQQDAKLSTATGYISLSAAGFLFQVTVHPTLEGGTGTSALPSGETFPPECEAFLGCLGSLRHPFIPNPSAAKGSRITGTSRAHCAAVDMKGWSVSGKYFPQQFSSGSSWKTPGHNQFPLKLPAVHAQWPVRALEGCLQQTYFFLSSFPLCCFFSFPSFHFLLGK